MQIAEPNADEILDLRRCVRDLTAFSALSAYWQRSDVAGVAEGLAEAILRSPHVDFVYVRAKGANEETAYEAAHTQQGPLHRDRVREIGKALDSLPKLDGCPLPPIPANLLDGQAARLVAIPIGHEGDCGLVLAGSHRLDFPSQADRLLLGVAVNQAAVVLQHKRIVQQREQTEQALRESEERFRLMANSIPQLAWMARPDGHIYWYNQRWFDYTGTTREQMEGWGWQSVHDADELPKVLRRWKESLATGQPLDMVFPLRGQDGVFRSFLTRVMPLRDTEGRIAHWFGTNTDITEIRTMEAALREADRRKDEFLATLAHELRNPLAPLRNALQIMKLSGNDQVSPSIRDMMERQLRQMVRLVDDLLDVSRISQGKIELHKERLTVATVVENALETSHPLLEAAHHELTITLPPEPLLVDGDLTRLAQVLSNLLNNAAKYTPEGGHIWLSAERDGSEAILRVRDNGAGIPADMLPRIFEMFTQMNRTLERAQGGLGIGLTLVRRLVEMHGGTVEAFSEGVGQGSTFLVRLPLSPLTSKRQQGGGKPGEGPQAPAAERRRILVVDDNVDSAQSLALLMQLAGNEVRMAHDGPSALEVAAALVPDVVLLDIGLPGMSGHDVARRMRAMPQLREAVLIAQTGWGQEEDRRRSEEAGFNVHLVKPVDPAALQRLLAALPKNRP